MVLHNDRVSFASGNPAKINPTALSASFIRHFINSIWRRKWSYLGEKNAMKRDKPILLDESSSSTL